jgi:hypothetical protein
MMSNRSVDASRNGMGRSSASGLSSLPRPVPLRAPNLNVDTLAAERDAEIESGRVAELDGPSVVAGLRAKYG